MDTFAVVGDRDVGLRFCDLVHLTSSLWGAFGNAGYTGQCPKQLTAKVAKKDR
jgi:hypothetical protein